MFYYLVCDTPTSKIGLSIFLVSHLIEDVYVEGDNISYSCTGYGVTDDDVISVCKDDGQWSLQTLPKCCKCKELVTRILLKGGLKPGILLTGFRCNPPATGSS